MKDLTQILDINTDGDISFDGYGVLFFAEEMRHKLDIKRRHGRGGWFTPECKIEDLKRMLIDHIDKGDFVDVANFCMMIECKKAMGQE